VLPVLIFALVAIPLLIAAFVGVRRSRVKTEREAEAEGTSPDEMEREFAAAEAYEEEWRRKQHHQPRDGPDV
jgi:uncharacterized membrane protein